jgi:nucleoid-associated protein YgaU
MSMASAAEANLDARIRPEISALRSRTSYSRRRPDARPQAPAHRPVPYLPVPGAGVPGAVQRAASAAARPGPVRLTGRGRIVVWALAAIGVAAITALIWLAVAGQAQASSHVRGGTPAAGSVRRVVVRQGETLWGIATRVDPAADPRVIIGEIVDLNSLSGTAIQAGQVLLVPAG